jgi:2'-hydroxyisoflavone reductase
MRMLVIGGTRFVGRYVVAAALARGHEVSLLHRGQTGAGLFPQAEHLTADRDFEAALVKALDGRSFDATVDVCAYVPRQVRILAEVLGGRGGHHVYVSSVSAYADPPEPGADESSPLVELDDKSTEEVTETTYGGLKTECERAAKAAYGEQNVTIVRPTYVVGPHDPTGRFTRWVDRIRKGGEVLAPGPADAPMQLVDARDQGTVMVSLAERRTAGAFNTIGIAPPFSFADMLESIVDTVGPAGTRLVWVDADRLAGEGVGGSMFPLWSEGGREYALAMSNEAILAAGMPVRPLADTIRDTLTWIDQPNGDAVYRTPPLSAEREAELLAKLVR